MATDAEGPGAVEEGAGAAPEQAEEAGGQMLDDPMSEGETDGDAHFFVEVWNDYDPSMRFVSIFPVGEDQGATASSVAYYILEPGKHTGLHSDNAEEVMFVTEGEGEAFVIGSTNKLEAGKFYVFPAGLEHDIYGMGSGELRLLSFFPTPEVISTFQQTIYPVGGNELSSKPPKPTVEQLDPNNLPADFPFSLEELGMAAPDEGAPKELSTTQRLLGMTEPGVPPPPEVWENATVTSVQPGPGEDAADSDAEAEPESAAGD